MASTLVSFPITENRQLIPIGTSYYLQEEVGRLVYLEDTRKADAWAWYDGSYARPCYLWNITRNSTLRVATELSNARGFFENQKIYTANGILDYIDVLAGECGLFLPIVDSSKFPVYSSKNLGWFCTILTSRYGNASTKTWTRKAYEPIIDDLLVDVLRLQFPSQGLTQAQLSEEVNKLNETIELINVDLANLKNLPAGVTKEQLDARAKELNDAIASLAAKITADEMISKEELSQELTAINTMIANLRTTLTQAQEETLNVTSKQLQDALAKHLADVDHNIDRGSTFPDSTDTSLFQLVGNSSIPDGLYMRDGNGNWIA